MQPLQNKGCHPIFRMRTGTDRCELHGGPWPCDKQVIPEHVEVTLLEQASVDHAWDTEKDDVFNTVADIDPASARIEYAFKAGYRAALEDKLGPDVR